DHLPYNASVNAPRSRRTCGPRSRALRGSRDDQRSGGSSTWSSTEMNRGNVVVTVDALSRRDSLEGAVARFPKQTRNLVRDGGDLFVASADLIRELGHAAVVKHLRQPLAQAPDRPVDGISIGVLVEPADDVHRARLPHVVVVRL